MERSIGMAVVLIIEIVSALIGCGALLALVAQTAYLKSKSEKRPAGKLDRLRRCHRFIGFALLAAGIVHGTAATLYASGARAEAYAIGWASIALFVLSGICMTPSVRARLHRATGVHVSLFALGVALFIAHIVMGRL